MLHTAPSRLTGPAAAASLAVAMGLGLSACGSATAPTAGAPKVRVAKLKDLPPPLPKPYDEAASFEATTATVDRAFAEAKAENKRVIVDLGGNWCSWCRMLAGVMALPEVKPFMDANFVVASVYVTSKKGHTDRNLALLSRFGSPKVDGYPWLIVAEPDGTVLASSYEVTDKHHETPQAMVNWLAKWAKRPAASVAVVGGVGRA